MSLDEDSNGLRNDRLREPDAQGAHSQEVAIPANGMWAQRVDPEPQLYGVSLPCCGSSRLVHRDSRFRRACGQHSCQVVAASLTPIQGASSRYLRMFDHRHSRSACYQPGCLGWLVPRRAAPGGHACSTTSVFAKRTLGAILFLRPTGHASPRPLFRVLFAEFLAHT